MWYQKEVELKFIIQIVNYNGGLSCIRLTSREEAQNRINDFLPEVKTLTVYKAIVRRQSKAGRWKLLVNTGLPAGKFLEAYEMKDL